MNETVVDLFEAKEMLDKYSDVLIGIDILRQDKEKLKDGVLTAEQKQALADIEAEFTPKIEELQEQADRLAEMLKSYVLERGETLSGTFHQVVYTKGKTLWDTKVLDKLAQFVTEIELAKSEGEPSVSIRARR